MQDQMILHILFLGLGWESEKALLPQRPAPLYWEVHMNRALCNIPGCKNLVALNQILKGKRYYRKICMGHHRERQGLPRTNTAGVKKYKMIDNFAVCSRCGFVPEDKVQMDRHHKNGNHKDHRLENIEILCANCHRFVSKLMRQGIIVP
jgi:5-methylcytosine-specific restriction endonuclease McrA